MQLLSVFKIYCWIS